MLSIGFVLLVTIISRLFVSVVILDFIGSALERCCLSVTAF